VSFVIIYRKRCVRGEWCMGYSSYGSKFCVRSYLCTEI